MAMTAPAINIPIGAPRDTGLGPNYIDFDARLSVVAQSRREELTCSSQQKDSTLRTGQIMPA